MTINFLIMHLNLKSFYDSSIILFLFGMNEFYF
jgi:hypothetical protein